MPKVKKDEGYDLYEHVHRFAAWAAARAAQRGLEGFKIEVGRRIIEGAQLNLVLKCGTGKLPDKECLMDAWHKSMRKKIIKEAGKQGLTLSHGRAAKLINVYMKSGFVTIANKHNKKVGLLHPPIDEAVLEGLRGNNKDLPRKWTQFDSDEYQTVINCVRDQLRNEKEERLWMIERYFRGYRG